MEHELRQVNDADKQYEDMETISEDEQEVIQEKVDEEIGKTYVTAFYWTIVITMNFLIETLKFTLSR